MKEPYVSVGILTDTSITFELTGIFSTPSYSVVSGRHTVTVSDTGLCFEWNGGKYTTLTFEPTSYDGDAFELAGVTIGVDFHWERKENQRFRGALRLIINAGKITAINDVRVEDYLVSVISSEMSATSSLQLLRAHSVISRSWLLKQMQNRIKTSTKAPSDATAKYPGEIIRWWDREDHTLFDVCADDHCQRYQGIARVSGYVAAGAVADTRGQVLTYDGELCDARFSKCCGGVFERFESCWEDTPHPYLTPRRDDVESEKYPDLSTEPEARRWINSNPTAFCNTTDDRILSQVLNRYDLERRDFYRWTEHYTQERISSLIRERGGFDLGEILALEPLERGTSGRIIRLRITGTKGDVVIGKELMIRRTLSESHLLSSAFTVERHMEHGKSVPDSFTLHGAGWGHGVGLCQIGAAVMGERGYSYDEILRHYYPGASIDKLY